MEPHGGISVKCYDDGTNGSSPKIARAFAAGCGGEVITSGELSPGDVAMWGSPRLWWTVLQPAISEGRIWYYADHAFWGRGQYFRIARNKYQHKGKGKSDGRRLRELGVEIKPWQSGSHVVVCPPDRAFANLMGVDSDKWVKKVARDLKASTDRRIIWRDRLDISTPLAHDLEKAHALVTFMSNAAVEALVAGVPVFCTGDCASSSMGLRRISRIESPVYPDDRERWASVLADNQWTLDEIARGCAWEKLREE